MPVANLAASRPPPPPPKVKRERRPRMTARYIRKVLGKPEPFATAQDAARYRQTMQRIARAVCDTATSGVKNPASGREVPPRGA